MNKKIKIALTCLLACFAWTAALAEKWTGFYTPEDVVAKVEAMELLEQQNLSHYFWVKEGVDFLSDAESLAQLEKARLVYENNKNSFAAVYNYATLWMSFASEKDIREELKTAVRLFEEAEQLRNDYYPLYQQKSLALQFLAMDFAAFHDYYMDESSISKWAQQKDLAYKEFITLGRLILSAPTPTNDSEVAGLLAYYTACALGNEKALAHFKKWKIVRDHYYAAYNKGIKDQAALDEFDRVSNEQFLLGAEWAKQAALDIDRQTSKQDAALKKELASSLREYQESL